MVDYPQSEQGGGEEKNDERNISDTCCVGKTDIWRWNHARDELGGEHEKQEYDRWKVCPPDSMTVPTGDSVQKIDRKRRGEYRCYVENPDPA